MFIIRRHLFFAIGLLNVIKMPYTFGWVFFAVFVFCFFCVFMFVFKGKRLIINKFSYTSTTRAVYLKNNRYSFCYSVSLRFMTKNENGASNILKILLYVLTEIFTKVTC